MSLESAINEYLNKKKEENLKKYAKQNETWVKQQSPLKVKSGIYNITHCFHPEGVKSFGGVYGGVQLYTEAVKKNNQSFNRTAKIIDKRPNGGMIIFSTDVNSESDAGAIDQEVANKITDYQREFAEGYVDSTIDSFALQKELDGIGYTIGKGFTGKYVNPATKQVYNENSLTIDLAGLTSAQLEELASDIAHNFSQTSVLLRDFNNNSTFFVDGSEVGSNE